ncbi:FAD/NAD(P)-binding domain-containing protein [[Candida] zeylanoides]
MRVAVIGAGPSGLAAAKALALEPSRPTVDVYEKGERAGGIWHYTHKPPAPSPDVSPMYKYLETNLVSEIMEYAKVHFPNHVARFPSRQQVLAYLESYLDTIEGVNFRFGAKVVSVAKSGNLWQVHSKGREAVDYDAVVYANGHFDVPYTPKVAGLDEWASQWPGSITHAKYYDDPNRFADETVLVVGHSASGSDIANQLSVKSRKVYVSSSSPAAMPIENQEAIPIVARYDAETKSVATTDGKTYRGIDSVIFCTGYLYSAPSLQEVDIVGDKMVSHVYKQIFYTQDPTLAFVGLPKNVVPMPMAESQAAVIARVLTGRIKLPTKIEMEAAYQAELKMKGAGSKFHEFKTPADTDYYIELNRWVSTASGGLEPREWTHELIALRERTVELKQERTNVIVDHIKYLKSQGMPFSFPPQD